MRSEEKNVRETVIPDNNNKMVNKITHWIKYKLKYNMRQTGQDGGTLPLLLLLLRYLINRCSLQYVMC